jgi:hypothetical protein
MMRRQRFERYETGLQFWEQIEQLGYPFRPRDDHIGATLQHRRQIARELNDIAITLVAEQQHGLVGRLATPIWVLSRAPP